MSFSPHMICIRGWLGLRPYVDVEMNRKVPTPTGNLTPNTRSEPTDFTESSFCFYILSVFLRLTQCTRPADTPDYKFCVLSEFYAVCNSLYGYNFSSLYTVAIYSWTPVPQAGGLCILTCSRLFVQDIRRHS
jgi:hypothetical protein